MTDESSTYRVCAGLLAVLVGLGWFVPLGHAACMSVGDDAAATPCEQCEVGVEHCLTGSSTVGVTLVSRQTDGNENEDAPAGPDIDGHVGVSTAWSREPVRPSSCNARVVHRVHPVVRRQSHLAVWGE